MGCGTCGTGGGGCSPSGCGSKSHCASGGCNRLNVYDWLNIGLLGDKHAEFDVVEVQFKSNRKGFFKNTNAMDLYKGDFVAVETAAGGYDVGKVILKGELVRLQLKRKRIKENDTGFLKIYRIATQADLDKLQEARNKEPEVLYKSRQIIDLVGIDLKLGDVEFQGDKTKATFYYTANGRIDFRELVKQLAAEFKVRVEMRQIGARQEAARIGGIGACGRELCCATWMTDFKSVNTSAARYQNLSLNPIKLAGQCGRLKCCLNYELDTYIDALKDFPKNADILKTKAGVAEQVKTDIFKKQIWYQYKASSDHSLFALPIDEVTKVLMMNAEGKFPDRLEDFAVVLSDIVLLDASGVAVEEAPDLEFEEGNINRFDKEKRGKNNKKPNQNQNANRNNPNQNRNNPSQPTAQNPNQNRNNPNQNRNAAQGAAGENVNPSQPTAQNPNQNRNNNPNQNRNAAQGAAGENVNPNRKPNQNRDNNPNQNRNAAQGAAGENVNPSQPTAQNPNQNRNNNPNQNRNNNPNQNRNAEQGAAGENVNLNRNNPNRNNAQAAGDGVNPNQNRNNPNRNNAQAAGENVNPNRNPNQNRNNNPNQNRNNPNQNRNTPQNASALPPSPPIPIKTEMPPHPADAHARKPTQNRPPNQPNP